MCRIGRTVVKVLVAVSFVVLVQARGAPKFIKTPKKKYSVYQGDTIKLRCSVTGTEDPMHNRTLTAWKKIGGKGVGVVRKSRAWRRFRVQNGKFLRIRKVKLEDAGTYLCVAKNPHGAVTAVIRLIVKVTNSTLSDVTTKGSPTVALRRAPTFRNDEKIKAFKISTGQKIKLRCQARGVPSPNVQWLKNNKKLNRLTGRHRRRITKWTLSFSRVTPSDSGIYQCFAWNQYGNISKTFIVQVKGQNDGKSFSPAPVKRKPVIQKHLLNNATATVGDLATFSCTAFSSLEPRFTWLKWTPLNSTSNETVLITVLNSSYPNLRFIGDGSHWTGDKPKGVMISYCHKLKFLNVSEADQGRYTCVVSSTAGFVSSDVYLTVKSKMTNDDNEEKPKDSTSNSQSTMGQIQIPIAALIAVPIAFGVILIVAIIWCYIQTVRHQEKFKMNSQPMSFPITNGSATHATSNGLYREMPRTLTMGTPVNRNVYDDIDGTRVYQGRGGNIPLENANNLMIYNQTDLQNHSNGETLSNRDEGCSHDNHRSRSPDHCLELEKRGDSGEIRRESHEYLEQSNQDDQHYQDHPEDTINTDNNTNNENNISQDCEEKDSCDEINYILNSVV